MKKLIMALGLILASSVILAQPQGGPNVVDKAPPAAPMENELGLTDEQVKQMRAIRDAGGTRAAMQAVLTPEQEAKAAELRKERKGERASRMKEHLGLSDEQAAQIRAIRKEGGSREEIRAVLTPEQQAKLDEARGKHQGEGPQAHE